MSVSRSTAIRVLEALFNCIVIIEDSMYPKQLLAIVQELTDKGNTPST